jgi:hypothetical protein
MPRLDYSGGSCPALLLEPQRSNIVANSEYMLDFIKSSATSLEANSATSPEGKNNATYYYCNTTSTNAYILQGWTGTSGVQYAVSFYAKAKELSIVYIKNVNDSGSQSYFDLSDGTFTLNSGIDSMSIEDAGEGWYRCTAVSTSTTTGIKWIPILKGDANEGVYVYGLQIEEGSYPTSYIPTYGASVTRGKDDMIITGSSSTSTTQGTIYVDFDRGLTSANERDASTDGLFFRSDSFPATDSFEISTDVSGAVRYGKRVASSFLTLHTDNTTDRYKSVFKWDNGAVKLYVNGTLEYQSASGFSITNILDEIGYSADFQKYVNKVVLFNSVLTDAEAIDLTTI